MDNLFEVREEYISQNLDETSVLPNPFNQFRVWFGEAAIVKIYEPHAAFLATASLKGTPSGRMILIKAFNEKGFVFFTNYESKKGHQLLENPFATLVFNWAELERQVRISGHVDKLTPDESDKYFETRPAGSRLGAWASPQSQVISSRKWLENKHNEFRQQFKHGEVPRPINWGGYNLKPINIEFWQGRQNRLHDRIEYYLEDNIWKIRRLAP